MAIRNTSVHSKNWYYLDAKNFVIVIKTKGEICDTINERIIIAVWTVTKPVAKTVTQDPSKRPFSTYHGNLLLVAPSPIWVDRRHKHHHHHNILCPLNRCLAVLLPLDHQTDPNQMVDLVSAVDQNPRQPSTLSFTNFNPVPVSSFKLTQSSWNKENPLCLPNQFRHTGAFALTVTVSS